MNNTTTVCLSIAVGLAAFVAFPVPTALVLVSGVAFLAWRNAKTLFVFAVLFASFSAAKTWAALDAPLASHVAGIATLTRDPEYMFGSQRAELSIDGRRYQVWASTEAGAALRPLLAGQQVYVEGTTAKLTGLAAPSQRRKHVAGRLDASEIRLVNQGTLLSRSANYVRNVLTAGLSYMPHDTRALALGMTIGDDREQSETSKQMFRDANLAHLTAVSGANVAFVLLMCAPLLLCFSLRGRLIGACLVLVVFGVMTRFEPSVIRAETMAAMFLIASFVGRPVSLIRALAMGVTVALMVDPLLVGSIGFLLSVSACAGIAVLAPIAVKILPGPSWLGKAVGFAFGAQIGVAPIQVAVFGSVPMVGLVSNLLAGPFAGLVMISATLGALVVHLFGSWIAPIALGPAQVFADVIIFIARWTVSWNFGNWTQEGLLMAVGATTLLLILLNATTFTRRVAPARVSNQRRRSIAGKPSR